jgi:UDP-N-acetylmuramate--alanine ligase
MDFNRLKHIYFLGIGGIGMSALARYFKAIGKEVSGYDKTSTNLTRAIENEGISVHYEDRGAAVIQHINPAESLVVYTPAIPKDFGELIAFQNADYAIFKRAQVLGLITENSFGIGVAGTHGKTTTSTMLAHVLNQSIGCNAFLGGIATNYNSNLILNSASEISVLEADEFDRSFLQLKPKAGVLTSIDADHLDIYGDTQHIVDGFQAYVNLIAEEGFVLMHHSIPLTASCKILRYGLSENADIAGLNPRMKDGFFWMDVHAHGTLWSDVKLGVPGLHNAENALAVIGVCLELGLNEQQIRTGLESFLGVKRRFEYIIRRADLVYVDDYAHHPSEIHALVSSIRLMYPNRKITGIFQPHLFSRTRDFMDGFADELSQLDEAILMPIYPARELPIEGITSEAVQEKMTLAAVKIMTHQEVVAHFKTNKPDVLLTIGAGDIDLIVQPLKEILC